MTADKIKLELEQIRGDIKNLETIVRMSIAEQKSLNLKYESTVEQLAHRMVRVESKLWWIQGLLGSTGVATVVMIIRLLVTMK